MSQSPKSSNLSVGGVNLGMLECGEGQALLLLHGNSTFSESTPFVRGLAKHFRVLAPSHPGFGHSSLPDDFDSVDDIAHCYLGLMAELDLIEVVLVGCSFGGWIAAEMATMCIHRLSKMILVDPVGISPLDADDERVADIFAMTPAQVAELTFHNPDMRETDFSSLSDDELQVYARDRESLALFSWQPYMHNPKLLRRLGRVNLDTAFIRGEHDGIASASYIKRFADAIPAATMMTILNAGHSPHLEQPELAINEVLKFVGLSA